MQKYLALGLTFVSLAACGGAPIDPELDSVNSELRSRIGNTTVWMEGAGRVTVEDGAPVIHLRGRASRNLTNVFSFIPDDAFAEAALRGPRSFELRIHAGHELNTLLSGLPLLVRLDLAAGGSITAQVTVGLRFANTRGSSAVRLDSAVVPISVRDAEQLRYRARIQSSAANLSVVGAGNPQLSHDGRNFAVDFSYTDLEAAITSGSRVTFRSSGGAQRSATLEVFPLALDTTDQDPYDAWPTAACARPVWDCVAAQTGSDLSACGSYREVQRCLYADVCEVVGSAPLSLAPIDLSFVWHDVQADFVTGCARGGTWCSLDALESYTVPECLAAPAQVSDIAAIIEPSLPGQILDRQGIEASVFFSTGYSSGGPALFQQVEGQFGGGEVEGWILTQPYSCHNCSNFSDVLILWYPQASRVLVLRGTHGYDS